MKEILVLDNYDDSYIATIVVSEDVDSQTVEDTLKEYRDDEEYNDYCYVDIIEIACEENGWDYYVDDDDREKIYI